MQLYYFILGRKCIALRNAHKWKIAKERKKTTTTNDDDEEEEEEEMS